MTSILLRIVSIIVRVSPLALHHFKRGHLYLFFSIFLPFESDFRRIRIYNLNVIFTRTVILNLVTLRVRWTYTAQLRFVNKRSCQYLTNVEWIHSTKRRLLFSSVLVRSWTKQNLRRFTAWFLVFSGWQGEVFAAF